MANDTNFKLTIDTKSATASIRGVADEATKMSSVTAESSTKAAQSVASLAQSFAGNGGLSNAIGQASNSLSTLESSGGVIGKIGGMLSSLVSGPIAMTIAGFAALATAVGAAIAAGRWRNFENGLRMAVIKQREAIEVTKNHIVRMNELSAAQARYNTAMQEAGRIGNPTQQEAAKQQAAANMKLEAQIAEIQEDARNRRAKLETDRAENEIAYRNSIEFQKSIVGNASWWMLKASEKTHNTFTDRESDKVNLGLMTNVEMDTKHAERMQQFDAAQFRIDADTNAAIEKLREEAKQAANKLEFETANALADSKMKNEITAAEQETEGRVRSLEQQRSNSLSVEGRLDLTDQIALEKELLSIEKQRIEAVTEISKKKGTELEQEAENVRFLRLANEAELRLNETIERRARSRAIDLAEQRRVIDVSQSEAEIESLFASHEGEQATAIAKRADSGQMAREAVENEIEIFRRTSHTLQPLERMKRAEELALRRAAAEARIKIEADAEAKILDATHARELQEAEIETRLTKQKAEIRMKDASGQLAAGESERLIAEAELAARREMDILNSTESEASRLTRQRDRDIERIDRGIALTEADIMAKYATPLAGATESVTSTWSRISSQLSQSSMMLSPEAKRLDSVIDVLAEIRDNTKGGGGLL